MRITASGGPFVPCAILRVCALVLSTAAVSAHAQQKTVLKRRGETIFATLPFDPAQAKSLSLSPGATRSAFVRPKATGFCAVVDGIEGPVFEHIGRAGVIFSPDSHHAAYAAEKQGTWRVVVGGVEGEPFDAVRDQTITFSEQAGRVAYVAERAGTALVVVDDKAGRPFVRIGDGSITFSPDGIHLAYIASDGRIEFVVYDGVQGPAYASVGPLRFSRAGGHFAFVASTGRQSIVIVDGAAVATRDGPGAVRPAGVTFSPDGTHLVFVAHGGDGRDLVVLDGAEGKPYDRVFEDSLAFGGDGARLAYVARRDGKARVVVNGTEIAAHAGVAPGSIRFSPDGRRVAYLVERPGPDRTLRRCVAIDGVEGKLYDWVGEPPVFSVDGRHIAYAADRRKAGGAGFESLLVVDAAESAGPYPWIRGDPVFRVDGRRVSYLAAAPDERFADAGLVPRVPGDSVAGARLVFHPSRDVREDAPPKVSPAPVKLLIVEEDVAVD